MFCGNCGTRLEEGSIVCPRCGTANFELEEMMKNVSKDECIDFFENGEGEEENKTGGKIEPNKDFVEPNEKIIAELGNGYFVNLLFHKLESCCGILTDKRVYLKGTFYNREQKNILKTVQEIIVDVEDITGTGFVYEKTSKITIFFGILSALLSLVSGWISSESNEGTWAFLCVGFVTSSLVLFIKAFWSKKTFFFIDYAGGSVKFDASLIGLGEVRDFHKQIRRVKDTKKGI